MTQDEFERILVALTQVGSYSFVNVANGKPLIPLESAIRIIHSNLHQEDRQKYNFDFPNNKWTKTE